MRHGEVDNPRHVVYASLPGYGLTERGRTQAEQVGRYLRSAPIVAVWSSPLERAIATAEPIAAHHDLPIRIHEDLGEWRMADDWAGIVWEDLPAERPGQLEAYLEHPDRLTFASETLQRLAGRMRQVLTELATRHDGDVVAVSHQDPVQAARLALAGRDLALQHTDKPMHGTVITLRPGNPWTELTSWSPEQGADTPSDVHPEAQSEQLGVGLEGEGR